MIIIIDFDGTIVTNNWPKIGELMPNVVEVIRRIKADGNEILIDTCRSGRYEGHAVDLLEKEGIPFDYVNCNLPSSIEYYGIDCRKLSGDVRIDDTNLGGIPQDWEEIYKMLIKHPKYPLKTSREWYELDQSLTILDPDGWPRDDRYDFAFNEELINAEEFYRRVSMSTIKIDSMKELKVK